MGRPDVAGVVEVVDDDNVVDVVIFILQNLE